MRWKVLFAGKQMAIASVKGQCSALVLEASFSQDREKRLSAGKQSLVYKPRDLLIALGHGGKAEQTDSASHLTDSERWKKSCY